MDMQVETLRHGTSESHPAASTVVVPVLVAAGLGGLTALGQAHLPEVLSPLANSSGSWTVVAFGCALVARSPRSATLVGGLAMLALLAGYVLANSVRGFPSSTALLLFWGVAGVTVGPLVGLGAHWARSRRDLWAGLGVGGPTGVLLGEGVYGLTVVSATTPAAYWWGSVLLGVLVATVASTVWLRGPTARLVAPVVAAAVAGAFVALYVWGGSIIGLL